MAATTNVTNTNKRSLPTEMQNLAIGDSGTPPTSKKQKVRSVHNIHTETASKTTSDHEMASESKADDDKTVETLIGQLRRQFKPRIGKSIQTLKTCGFSTGDKTTALGNAKEIEAQFPNTYGQPIVDIDTVNDVDSKDQENGHKLNLSALRVGVVLSGGQASGGHNVITGLFDALKELNSDSTLVGFTGGPKGVMINRFMKLTADKIQTQEQKLASLKTVNDNKLDGLVIIGGDDSNTNAAILAEFFQKHKSKCTVVGIPKTIDGDLQNEYIEVSFGFDTAVKTYSEMISNIARDSLSAAKAWHFIKLMGRDASQVTLDCAIMTQCNMALIGEEIQNESMLLSDITEKMCDMIQQQALNGKNYGVILIPEGVIQFIPSMKVLIDFLNTTLKEGSVHLKKIEAFAEMSDKIRYVRTLLKSSSPTNLSNFDVLPRDIQAQLLLERDPHGNIQISQVPIEQLFMQICAQKLKTRKRYVASGTKFRANGHFFGYA